MGKTKAGKGMKLEIIVDGSGLPLGLEVAAADISEQELLIPALEDVPVEIRPGTPVVADKGHDSDPLRDEIEKAGCTPVIPHRKNRVKPSRNDGRRLRRYRHRGSSSAPMLGFIAIAAWPCVGHITHSCMWGWRIWPLFTWPYYSGMENAQ